MTLHFNLNKSGLGGNHTMWWLWQTLVDAGHTVRASGSGTGGTYSALGDVFDPVNNPYDYTSGVASGQLGTGAGNEPWCAAPLCWILITMLDGTEWLFQRDSGSAITDDDEWTIAFSPAGLFNLAGCAANIAPTAADQHVFFGNINGAGFSLFQTGGLVNLTHVVADDIPNSDGFYGFRMIEMISPNALNGFFIVDKGAQRKSDLMAAMPIVFHIGKSATGLDDSDISSAGTCPLALVDYGGGTELWDDAIYHVIYGSTGNLYPDSAGAPALGQPDHPITVGNRGHGGMFFLSECMKWQATARSYPDTNVALTDWFVGDVALTMGDGVSTPTAIP
jgi:hypothetical protein